LLQTRLGQGRALPESRFGDGIERWPQGCSLGPTCSRRHHNKALQVTSSFAELRLLRKGNSCRVGCCSSRSHCLTSAPNTRAALAGSTLPAIFTMRSSPGREQHRGSFAFNVIPANKAIDMVQAFEGRIENAPWSVEMFPVPLQNARNANSVSKRNSGGKRRATTSRTCCPCRNRVDQLPLR
jgi:hypothetical protein